MTKGTASLGKRGKRPTHLICRRCGKRAYHKRLKVCASCGFGRTKKRRNPTWAKSH